MAENIMDIVLFLLGAGAVFVYFTWDKDKKVKDYEKSKTDYNETIRKSAERVGELVKELGVVLPKRDKNLTPEEKVETWKKRLKK